MRIVRASLLQNGDELLPGKEKVLRVERDGDSINLILQMPGRHRTRLWKVDPRHEFQVSDG